MPDDFSYPIAEIEAEQWCLGGCMRDPAALTAVVEELDPDDFLRPAHQEIYHSMITLWSQGIPADPVSLKDEMAKCGTLRSLGERGAVYLADLYGQAMAILPTGVVHHAEIIRDRAARRKIRTISTQLAARAADPASDLSELVTAAQDGIGLAVLTAAAARNRGRDVQNAAQFLDLDEAQQPVLIPGLLSRQDRVIIVGFEGDGKSTLGYQVALCGAAGLHPFVHTPVPPFKVLILDLENSPGQAQGILRRWLPLAQQSPAWSAQNLSIMCKPGGIDLTRAADRMRITEAIREAGPDLIVGGPIYKMISDRGQGAEQLHSQVTGFWDEIRERFDTGLWLEHHPPGKSAGSSVREVVPAFSTIYRRWPEFGFGLKRSTKRRGTLEWTRFRGDRVEGRMWPASISRSGTGGWPWSPAYPDGTFTDSHERWERRHGRDGEAESA